MAEGVLREKEKEKEKATFVVKVNFRQNATWQGTISWTNQKKTQYFRSALELVRLMDEALLQQNNEIPVLWEQEE